VSTPPEGEQSESDPGEATVGAPLTCYRHAGRETGVRCTRCERPICPECMVPAAVGFQCPECLNEGRKSMRPVRTVYGGTVNRGGVDITRVLVGINVIVFVLTLLDGANAVDGGGQSSIYDRFALIPAEVAGGEWYRLFSSMFLHFGFLHIAFNMWALLVIGGPLEQLLGRVRFVVLYVLSGLGGSVLSFSTGPLLVKAAGASGAIFGLFAAMYVVNRQRGLETGPIVGLIAINLVISFTFSGIDWRGHVGGLITGAVVAAVLAFAPRGPQRDRIQAAGCVGVALCLFAATLVGVDNVKDRCAAPATQRDLIACLSAGLIDTSQFAPGDG
jgi:membrane associated rhomboid family serine protease